VRDASLAVVYNALVLFGGFSDQGNFNDVYTLQLQGKDAMKWRKHVVSEGRKVPHARHGHTLTRIPRYVFPRLREWRIACTTKKKSNSFAPSFFLSARPFSFSMCRSCAFFCAQVG
jgi:hypothetical protein